MLCIYIGYNNRDTVEKMYYEFSLGIKIDQIHSSYNSYILETERNQEYIWYVYPLKKNKKIRK